MFPVWLFGFLLSLDAVISNGFGPTNRLRTILALAILFSVGLIYVSGWMENPVLWINGGTVCIFALAGTCLLAGNFLFPPPHVYSGPLQAADEKSPASFCRQKIKPARDDLEINFGDDEVVGRGAGPLGPLLVGSCSAVTLTRTGRGLLVDAFSYDSFGNIEWHIDHNKFTLMSGAFVTPDGFHFGNFITLDRTDKSALRLVDDAGRKIFELRYRNWNEVRISSSAECGRLNLDAVRDGAMHMGGKSAGPSCSVITPRADQ